MTWMPRWMQGCLAAVFFCFPITTLSDPSDHAGEAAALTYLCTGEEIDIDIRLDDAGSATVRLEADLFPYCLTTVDASHCADEACRESALDACLADTVLEWVFGDGGMQRAGASVTRTYGRAGDFSISVGIGSGESTLPGASCDLTLQPTRVTWLSEVVFAGALRELAPGDRFEVAISVATTTGVGTVKDFEFVLPGMLSVDTRLFSIVMSSEATASLAEVGPGEGIWFGRFVVEVLGEGAGHVALPMRYRIDEDVTLATARERVVVGPDPLGAFLPILEYLLEAH